MGEIYVSQVAELRKRKNMTQRQLADVVGVDPSTVRNWERDRGGLESFVKLSRLCKALDCLPEELFEEQNLKSEPAIADKATSKRKKGGDVNAS